MLSTTICTTTMQIMTSFKTSRNAYIGSWAEKKNIRVAILLLYDICNTIVGRPCATWAILFKPKSGAIVSQYRIVVAFQIS